LGLVHEGDVAGRDASARDGDEAEQCPVADQEGRDDADEEGHAGLELHGGDENQTGE